jgi:secreted trypsin-like serine protease
MNYGRSNPVNNEVFTVIGFGATSDCKTCNELDDGDIVDSVMLCAGVPGNGQHFCEGGSSGPIYTHLGMVSWGYGCAWENFSSVYSRVSGTKNSIDAAIC